MPQAERVLRNRPLISPRRDGETSLTDSIRDKKERRPKSHSQTGQPVDFEPDLKPLAVDIPIQPLTPHLLVVPEEIRIEPDEIKSLAQEIDLESEKTSRAMARVEIDNSQPSPDKEVEIEGLTPLARLEVFLADNREMMQAGGDPSLESLTMAYEAYDLGLTPESAVPVFEGINSLIRGARDTVEEKGEAEMVEWLLKNTYGKIRYHRKRNSLSQVFLEKKPRMNCQVPVKLLGIILEKLGYDSRTEIAVQYFRGHVRLLFKLNNQWQALEGTQVREVGDTRGTVVVSLYDQKRLLVGLQPEEQHELMLTQVKNREASTAYRPDNSLLGWIKKGLDILDDKIGRLGNPEVESWQPGAASRIKFQAFGQLKALLLTYKPGVSIKRSHVLAVAAGFAGLCGTYLGCNIGSQRVDSVDSFIEAAEEDAEKMQIAALAAVEQVAEIIDEKIAPPARAQTQEAAAISGQTSLGQTAPKVERKPATFSMISPEELAEIEKQNQATYGIVDFACDFPIEDGQVYSLSGHAGRYYSEDPSLDDTIFTIPHLQELDPELREVSDSLWRYLFQDFYKLDDIPKQTGVVEDESDIGHAKPPNLQYTVRFYGENLHFTREEVEAVQRQVWWNTDLSGHSANNTLIIELNGEEVGRFTQFQELTPGIIDTVPHIKTGNVAIGYNLTGYNAINVETLGALINRFYLYDSMIDPLITNDIPTLEIRHDQSLPSKQLTPMDIEGDSEALGKVLFRLDTAEQKFFQANLIIHGDITVDTFPRDRQWNAIKYLEVDGSIASYSLDGLNIEVLDLSHTEKSDLVHDLSGARIKYLRIRAKDVKALASQLSSMDFSLEEVQVLINPGEDPDIAIDSSTQATLRYHVGHVDIVH